jgi:hypothetical protein
MSLIVVDRKNVGDKIDQVINGLSCTNCLPA